jgi:hypothetical protein
MLLAVFGVVALASVASAQQPQPYYPAPAPTYSPAAVAARPVQPVSGTNVIQGDGCSSANSCGSNCGPAVRGAFKMVGGGDCKYGHACQNGCGSVKSDLAFHFGSCKDFFNPCGPTLGGKHGGGCGPFLFSPKCGVTQFAAPWGQGWCCPRAYDSYANH